MKKEDLKIGDIVKLKSGGPQMTINYIQSQKESDIISSVFFNKTDEFISVISRRESLILVKN
jgi:uncharacterized protein YodC (DUF2158 family)